MGLDVYLYKRTAKTWAAEEKLEDTTSIELPSVIHPDQYFKIGYFRSSYNNAGINKVLGTLDIPDLYDIFDKENRGEYHVCPDWDASLTRAKKSLKLLRDATVNKSYGVEQFSVRSMFPRAKNASEALKTFLSKKKEHEDAKSDYNDFGCREGDFRLGGETYYGFIPGEGFHDPCVYAIYKKDLSDYVKSLEVVVETIEWVLGQENPELYYFHWSA